MRSTGSGQPHNNVGAAGTRDPAEGGLFCGRHQPRAGTPGGLRGTQGGSTLPARQSGIGDGVPSGTLTRTSMATIYRTLLAKGYFPKELPPHFFTEQFARYATSRTGRAALANFKPTNNMTECAEYDLALPGGGRRTLGIPHPGSFANLAALVAGSFARLLKKAGASRCSRSKPVYADTTRRALQPSVRPWNLAREKAVVRAGAQFLLKIDISQFYPSLYTHAIGWAVDPKLRDKRHWKNSKLLGKKLDQAMMDLQGKVSQGVPIGNDISFLLSEVVLGHIDKTLRLPRDRALRWFDDYEVACSSMDEAERRLGEIQDMLATFRLKLNSSKTKIVPLPEPANEIWHVELQDWARQTISRAGTPDMVSFFDMAFRFRGAHRDAPVLSHALGLLFRLRAPTGHAANVAMSAITQAMLAEPGVTQKALSLVTYWHLNGLPLDAPLLTRTISDVILQQRHRGLTSDVSWGLSFCVQNNLTPTKPAIEALDACSDNCVFLQSLHLRAAGRLPRGFGAAALRTAIKQGDLDGPDWLLLYEAHRQHFTRGAPTLVTAHPLFSQMLARNVAFYRKDIPAYSAIIHPGGAPEWVVNQWMATVRKQDAQHQPERIALDTHAGPPAQPGAPTAPPVVAEQPPQNGSATPSPGDTRLEIPAPVLALIEADVSRVDELPETNDDLISELMGIDDASIVTIEDDDDTGDTYPV